MRKAKAKQNVERGAQPSDLKKPITAFLIFITLSPLIIGIVYAWDPTTSDLTGTNSSTNNSVSGTNRRFDIDGSSSPTVYGMQTGEDSDSIAHLMKTGAIQASSVFSTVTTSTSATGTQEPFQRKCFYANGRYWFFYYDLYYTSTDGSTWSEYSTGASVDSVYFDGTYLHYVDGGIYIYYRRGTPNSDGTITWSAAEQEVSTTYGEIWWPTVSVDSNGYVWVGYADGYSNAYPFVIKSGNNDGTWGTTPSGFPYQLSSTSMSVVVPIPLTGGKMFVLYHVNGDPVYGKRWTGSTWGSERATSSSADQFYSAVGESDYVHLVFNTAPSTDIIYEKYTYASDAWGTETSIQTINSWDQYPVLCRNPANNDLYVFWSGYPTDDHIYYKKCSGGSWDTNPTDWINEGSDTLADNEGLTCFYLSNGNKIGLAYTTKTSSPYNVKFATLLLNAGFQVPGMTTNDQYEIDFTIGNENFCMLFIATGSNSGTLKLFYKSTGAGSWSSGETLTQGSIVSGTIYQSGSGYTGFRLTNSSSGADGAIKFIVNKNYLASLGASGSSITGVYSATFQGGNGNPGSGGATPNDRCPSSGSASWTYGPPWLATNFAFVDGGSVYMDSTSEFILATLTTTSFDSGNNFVMAIVQLSASNTVSVAVGNLRLTRGGSNLMTNVYAISLSNSNPNTQKWYALMAFDSSAPQNPTYDVRATASTANRLSGEAKILAISCLTGQSAQGSSMYIGNTETTLATLSTSLPAGDNVVMAILESYNSAGSTRYVSALNLKRGSTLASAQYPLIYAASGTAAGAWQVQLIPYFDSGAPASAQYTVTATASAGSSVYGRATIVAFSRGGLSAAYSDGGSTTISTSVTNINTLTTSFNLGYDVAVIASEQFNNTNTGSTRTISSGANLLEQNTQTGGATSNEYNILVPIKGQNDNGKGFGLLNKYTSIPSGPEYEVRASTVTGNVNGESKILALSKPPKVPEFPLGPALILAICSPILFAVRRWRRPGYASQVLSPF